MAIGTTPLFSKISGSAGPVDFRTRRNGKIEIGKKRIPANPQSTEQQNTRNAYGRLHELWQNAAWIDKTPYINIATAYNISSWNAFLMCHLAIMRLNPVGYWPFVEGVGNTLHDFTTNNNHGTISGATWQKIDKYNIPSLYFDGIDDIVYCGTDPSLNILDTITLYALYKFTNDGGNHTFAARAYGWMVNSPYANTIANYGNDGIVSTGSNTPWIDEHDNKNIATTNKIREYTGAWTAQLKINGVTKNEVTTPAFTGPKLTGPTNIGDRVISSTPTLGTIKELAIFNYITSDEQDTSMYNTSEKIYGVFP